MLSFDQGQRFGQIPVDPLGVAPPALPRFPPLIQALERPHMDNPVQPPGLDDPVAHQPTISLYDRQAFPAELLDIAVESTDLDLIRPHLKDHTIPRFRSRMSTPPSKSPDRNRAKSPRGSAPRANPPRRGYARAVSVHCPRRPACARAGAL